MEFDFSIIYDSDEKNFEGLDMYYGSKSLLGVSEAIAIATHGIVNGNFISKTPYVKGFKNDFKTSFEGSFKQRFKISFTSEETIRKIEEITPKSYIELLKNTFNNVLGKHEELQRRGSKKVFSKMYYSEDLSSRLTSSLKDVHAPIKNQGYKATLYAANTPIVNFNKNTLSYLEEEIVSPEAETITVGISRFNARTGTGRLIAGLDDDSYSFFPDKNMLLSRAIKRVLIRSLRGVADNEFIPIEAQVRRVMANDGSTKFFLLQSAKLADQ